MCSHRSSLLGGERGEGCWEGAKAYDSEKAWSSINIKYYLGQDVPAVDGFSETEDQSYNKAETDNQQVKKCMAALFVNFVGTL